MDGRRRGSDMSVNWGTELWDQFENLEKHTGWGIDFLEKYTKFVKERADIELNYAKQIRSLSKKYLPKRSREDDSRYTWCAAFSATLGKLGDLAARHEEVADDLNGNVTDDLGRFAQEIKAERKSLFQDGRRAQQHMETSWKQLESSKRRFERDSKEAERAQLACNKMDVDNNVDANDKQRCSFKARQVAQQKSQTAQESKEEYLKTLKQFNQDQHEHYHKLVPVIYQRIQEMEERRIERVASAMRLSATAEKKSLPDLARCLDAMMDIAQSVRPQTDTRSVVSAFKSGFEPPGDLDPEDFGCASMRRSVSESSYLDHRVEGRRPSKKLWPFLRKTKLSLKLGPAPSDCSHLPAEQRRKKLENRIHRIGREILREREQREALVKMKAVYRQNPGLGDGAALEPRLDEVRRSLHGLEEELRNNQAWLAEARHALSAACPPSSRFATSPDSRESPDGSYAEEREGEVRFSKSRSSDFDDDDDDFEDEEPLPSIGTCKSLYPFQGQNEGTLSMCEGELLNVVEEDKGDGWTRVRRNAEQEGYVPTSYIQVLLVADKGLVQTGRMV
ncbi:formin-binding protein 1-like isoform X3 [Stigmatopora argus]